MQGWIGYYPIENTCNATRLCLKKLNQILKKLNWKLCVLDNNIDVITERTGKIVYHDWG